MTSKNEKSNIRSIVDVGPARAKKLKAAGFDTAEKISRATPEELNEKCQIHIDLGEKIIKDANRIANPRTAVELERIIDRLQGEIDRLYDWVLGNDGEIHDIQKSMIVNALINDKLAVHVSGPHSNPGKMATCVCCGRTIFHSDPIYCVYKLDKTGNMIAYWSHIQCISKTWLKLSEMQNRD